MNFRNNYKYHIVNQIVQVALMKFHIFSNLFDSPHVVTTGYKSVVAVLCFHGKSSYYFPTSLVFLFFQLWGHIFLI